MPLGGSMHALSDLADNALQVGAVLCKVVHAHVDGLVGLGLLWGKRSVFVVRLIGDLVLN
eukprot:9921764-Lingulodinium_polyedra.AAC.1